MRVSVEVEGLAELEKSLLALGENIALNIVRDAGTKAMQPVVDEMIRHAGFNPENDGEHMRDTIRVRSRSRVRDGRWPTLMTFRAGPSAPHTIKARAQEYGTYKQVAIPFMRPALDNNIPKILSTLAREIRAGINSYK